MIKEEKEGRQSQDIGQLIRCLPHQNQHKECTDCVCLIFISILLLGFFGLGLYFIVTEHSNLNKSFRDKILEEDMRIYIYQPLEMLKQLFIKYWPYITSCVAFSIILQIFSIAFFVSKPNLAFYLAIFTTILILLGTIAISIVMKAILLLLLSLGGLLLYVVFLLSIRNHFDEGIKFVHEYQIFKRYQWRILCVPVLAVLVLIVFLSFWVITLIIIQVRFTIYSNNKLDFGLQLFSLIFWICIFVFIQNQIYYQMVFLISSLIYQSARNKKASLLEAFHCLWRYHLGSTIFISFFILILKVPTLLSSFFLQKRKIVSTYLFFFICCLKDISKISIYLSDIAIIAMPIFGKNLVKTARTVERICSVQKNQKSFFIHDKFSEILKFGSIVTNCGLPSLVCYLAVTVFTEKNLQNNIAMTAIYLFTFLLCFIFIFFFISVGTINSRCYLFLSLWDIYLENQAKQAMKKAEFKENQNQRKLTQSFPRIRLYLIPRLNQWRKNQEKSQYQEVKIEAQTQRKQ